jgi:predicted Zn-dependent peptidase
LTDFRFGLLFDEIRNKEGLVYDISMDINFNGGNYYEFFFSSTEENASKVIAIIKQSLEKYDDFIIKNLEYIKNRYILNQQLDWGDIQNNYLNYIDKVVSRRAVISTEAMIESVRNITAKELIEYNQKFLDAFNGKVLTFKLRHGKEIKTEE